MLAWRQPPSPACRPTEQQEQQCGDASGMLRDCPGPDGEIPTSSGLSACMIEGPCWFRMDACQHRKHTENVQQRSCLTH